MYPDPSDTIGYRVRHLLANVYLYLYTIPLFVPRHLIGSAV